MGQAWNRNPTIQQPAQPICCSQLSLHNGPPRRKDFRFSAWRSCYTLNDGLHSLLTRSDCAPSEKAICRSSTSCCSPWPHQQPVWLDRFCMNCSSRNATPASRSKESKCEPAPAWGLGSFCTSFRSKLVILCHSEPHLRYAAHPVRCPLFLPLAAPDPDMLPGQPSIAFRCDMGPLVANLCKRMVERQKPAATIRKTSVTKDGPFLSFQPPALCSHRY